MWDTALPLSHRPNPHKGANRDVPSIPQAPHGNAGVFLLCTQKSSPPSAINHPTPGGRQASLGPRGEPGAQGTSTTRLGTCTSPAHSSETTFKKTAACRLPSVPITSSPGTRHHAPQSPCIDFIYSKEISQAHSRLQTTRESENLPRNWATAAYPEDSGDNTSLNEKNLFVSQSCHRTQDTGRGNQCFLFFVFFFLWAR